MSTPVTLYKNQKYTELKQACKEQHKLFEDPEFPASDSSLFPHSQPPGTVEWKRPREICDDPCLFIEGVSCHNLNQGMLGNCSFVAACSCLALKPKLWKKVIPEWEEQDWDSSCPDNNTGIFHFVFWLFGELVDVVVDDRLPTIDGALVYCHSESKNEFWSALLEKACAKLCGSYERLQSCCTGDVLADFTGGMAERVDLEAGGYVADVSQQPCLFKVLRRAHEWGAIISGSIKATPDEMGDNMSCGLVRGHAYPVTAITNIRLGSEKMPMVRMRNPWGSTEWNGAWSGSSEEWNNMAAAEKVSVGLTVEDDGEFWIAFEDWCKYITDVDICHLTNTSAGKTWKNAVLYGSWTKHPVPILNRSGGNSQETFLQNPQYMFDTGKDEGEVLIALQQRDRRIHKTAENGENLTVGFVLIKVELNRKYRMHAVKTQKVLATSGYSKAQSVFIRQILPKGCYIIVPTTLEAEELGQFMIRLFTDVDCGFREVRRDKPRVNCWSRFLGYPQVVTQIHVEGVEGLENQDSSGGRSVADPYVIITCEGKTVQSKVIKNTLDPTFDTRAIFYRKKPSKPIIVEVWDSDVMQDEVMGQVVLPASTGNTDEYLKLQLHKIEQNVKVPGTISIRVINSTQLTSM